MTLAVTIRCDGEARQFEANGDGPVVVAAFRAWLADLQVSATGADEVDRMGDTLLAAAAEMRVVREALKESEAREALMAEALGVRPMESSSTASS